MIRQNPIPVFIRLPALMVLALLVAGCMLGRQLSSVSIVAPQVDVAANPDWPQADWSLQVQRPQADQMRDSDRLLVRVSRSRLQPFPGAAWLDSMPAMVQALMIQQFEDSDRFAGVGRAGGMRSRFSLSTEIRHFEAVDDGQPGLGVDLAIQANLIHHRSGRVLASRTFNHQARVSGTDLDPLVEAFETAMGALFADLTGWVLTEGERAAQQFEQWRDRDRPRDRDRKRPEN